MQYKVTRIERGEEVFTQMRFKKRDWEKLKDIYKLKPIRESARYVYLEVPGDMLSTPRGVRYVGP